MDAKNTYFIEDEVVRVALTQGRETTVDLADWPSVSRYRWCAHKRQRTWYAVTNTGKKSVSLHQILMPAQGCLTPDHRDRNGLNNRRSNLRYATNREQTFNTSKHKDAVGSKFKGVSFDTSRGLFLARISMNGKSKNLGRFKNEIDAARAYDSAARNSRGSFAYLNFPN